MTVDALKRLAEELEAGTKYETMGHTMLCQRAFPKPDDFDGSRESYAKSDAQQAILAWRNGSLDAAKALHEVVLPNSPLDIVVTSGYSRVSIYSGPKAPFHARNENVARAWLLAVLKALIAQEESK